MRTLPLLCLLLLALPSATLAQADVTTTQTETEIDITAPDGAKFDVKVGKDAMDNDVLVIEGKDGTTVNGQAKFEIRLNPGANRFKKVEVFGGDEVTVDLSGMPEDRRLQELEVRATDNVTVKNVQTEPNGKIRVATGDTATVEDCDTANMNLLGVDEVRVRRCNVDKRLRVLNDEGDVDAAVEDSFYEKGEFGVKDPEKVRSLKTRVQRSQSKKVSFSGNGGNDEVAFEDSESDSVAVKLGGGADTVSLAGSVIHKASLDGGAGALDCFEDAGGNVLGSVKLKGFEKGACEGVDLAFGPTGQNPFVEPPEDAVAWIVSDGGHTDGPFALPGAENPLGLPELDPAALPDPAHWGQGPECAAGPVQLHHVHDAFEGHGDPNPSGCGHGTLAWGFLDPI
jgi:hypothetical protein